ncbi:NUDIX hydrolase [Streptomyces sp. NPDC047981]|uniref:NUDIX hydrolase n=1 Tax=Streptomyces sp. NPDC047981 TaxID=3154610 RepID=UPI003422BBED
MTAADPILAAGCVLWRRMPYGGGGTQIAVIFRPKWRDWSHPKGKLKRGEDPRAGALREVLEETGMTCELGIELSSVRYEVQGRPKVVRYWAAEATGGWFEPNREVTRLLWLSPTAARARLTRTRDKELLDAFLTARKGA